MNIIAINGSPRKNGNTSLMIKAFLDGLEHGTFTSEVIFLQSLKVKTCNDCRACKSGDLDCTVKDDLARVYPKLESADTLIFGTPIYWFTPTAQMKTVIDRLRPYYKSERLKGKKAILLMPAGVGSGDCDLTIEMFKRVFRALQIEYLGVVTAKAYDEGEALKDETAMTNIKNLAAKINKLS
jgi:multimeric flavodoxin WrbA